MGSLAIPCAIGWNGIGPKLREGDGRTPIGQFTIVEWRRRQDIWTIFRPDCRSIKRTDGWCDDPASNCYNRPVTLPFRAGAENLWRDDGVYDVIGIIDFNFSPRVKAEEARSLFISRMMTAAQQLDASQSNVRPCEKCKFCALPKSGFESAYRPVSRDPKIAEPIRTDVAPS